MITEWRDHDTRLRTAAFERVGELRAQYGEAIPWSAIETGFSLGSSRHPMSSKAEGIYKPKGHPAALSIKTTVPRSGRTNPYDDEIASNAEYIRYAYKERGGPDSAANQSLRVARQFQLPLIYFCGTAPARYAAVFPVYIEDDSRETHFFTMIPGEQVLDSVRGVDHAHFVVAPRRVGERRYVLRTVRQRLHQARFREMVMDAYGDRCAMCSIRRRDLLEAAHIVPDADERGRPEIQNGLALCGLHHEAFDRYLLDVTDDYRLELSPTLRDDRDGPVFQSAFLERDGAQLHLPRRQSEWPRREYLRIRRDRRPNGTW